MDECWLSNSELNITELIPGQTGATNEPINEHANVGKSALTQVIRA
jgi:hypothetical protein